MDVIRGSEYSSFLRCRRRWNWEWNEGLKPKKLNDKLFIGSLIHKYLEVLYSTNDFDLAFKAMQKMYLEADTQYSDEVELRETWDLVNKITNHYNQTWYETDKEYKTIATELQFMVKLDETIAFTGTIDWVFEDKDGHIWFADHKTTNSIEKYEKNSIMDRQISRYWWALQQIAAGVGRVMNKETGMWEKYEPLLGKEIFGFQYNIILKEIPKKPELLKKGGLSKAKNQKTTFDLYWSAMIEQGIADKEFYPAEYNEILQFLSEQQNRYFKRVDVTRLQPEIEASMWEFLYTAEDMSGLRAVLELAKDPAELLTMQQFNKDPNNKLYRNITGDCQWDCSFKSLCQAEIEGVNSSFLLKSLYEKGDK